jgi:hypothetical protein
MNKLISFEFEETDPDPASAFLLANRASVFECLFYRKVCIPTGSGRGSKAQDAFVFTGLII